MMLLVEKRAVLEPAASFLSLCNGFNLLCEIDGISTQTTSNKSTPFSGTFCSIHSSIDMFEAFDELLLLKRGGKVIYSGPLGRNSHKIIECFEAIPGVPKIKDMYNPATWMLEVSSIAAEVRLGMDFAEYYKSSALFQRNKALVQELSTPPPGTSDLNFPTKYSQSTLGQFKSCLWKQWLTYWRSPDYNLVRYFFTLACALMIGTVFWRIGKNKESSTDLAMIIGAMYAAVIFVGINNCQTVQPIVAIEKTVLYRERAVGMYAPFLNYISIRLCIMIM